MQRRVFSTIAATGFGLGLVVAAASPSRADATGTASLTGGGTLDAKSAGVSVSFVYSCQWDPGSDLQIGNAQATVTQKVGGKTVAQASNLFINTLMCDGTQHTATMSGSTMSGAAFKHGVALVDGVVSVCENFSCTDIPLRGEVKLTQK